MYFIYRAKDKNQKACDFSFVGIAPTYEKAKAKVNEEKVIDRAIKKKAIYPIYYLRGVGFGSYHQM